MRLGVSVLYTRVNVLFLESVEVHDSKTHWPLFRKAAPRSAMLICFASSSSRSICSASCIPWKCLNLGDCWDSLLDWVRLTSFDSTFWAILAKPSSCKSNAAWRCLLSVGLWGRLVVWIAPSLLLLLSEACVEMSFLSLRASLCKSLVDLLARCVYPVLIRRTLNHDVTLNVPLHV